MQESLKEVATIDLIIAKRKLENELFAIKEELSKRTEAGPIQKFLGGIDYMED